MIATIVLAALVGAAVAAPAISKNIHAPYFPGYILTAEYQCDDFMCPDWSLVVTRVTTLWARNETAPIATLLPESPIADMDFQVLTAYNNITRVFYVAGNIQKEGARIWTVAIDAAVNDAVITNVTNIHYPGNATSIARIHASPNNVLTATFSNGDVYSVDFATSKLDLVGNVLPGSALANGVVTQASSVNYDLNVLYTLVKTRNSKEVFVVTLNLTSGATSSVGLTLDKEMEKIEKWEQEDLFHALWIPVENQLLVFADGTDLGFDQIFWVNTESGATNFWQANLAENLYWFQVNTQTKTDDTLQTGTYDFLNGYIYFQCTQNQGTDDDVADPTVIAFLELAHPSYPPNVAVTFTFGYIGYAFAPIIN